LGGRVKPVEIEKTPLPTYGTEFQIDVLFFYKRTITMNLNSSGFQKTDATSTVEYDLTREPPLR
jgi:hypothetical protein